MREKILGFLYWKPLHFVLIGLVAFALLSPGAGRREIREPVRLGPAQIDALRASWVASVGREPDEVEMRALLQRELDDELLVREALARSLHLIDPVVRQRLLLNMRFLGASEDADDDALFRQALDLGMVRNDLVVRRRLVQIMEMSITDGVDALEPTPEELEAMYQKRGEMLLLPERRRISHVYFSRDRRGDVSERDAREAIRRIDKGKLKPSEARALGDPFLGGHDLPLLNGMQLAGQFGEQFRGSLGTCELHRWCGPIASSYGLHLVWTEEIVAERMPSIDEPEVRRRLVADIMRERSDRRLAQALDSLRQKYGVQS